MVIKIGRQFRTRKKHGSERAPCFVWSAASTADVFYVLSRTAPHLIIKKEKALAVLAALKAKYGDRLEVV
jgi:hypothetical protein